MYQKNPCFIQPPDLQIKVWRYLDFAKFISFLETRQLHFTRVDKLGDPFEGSWPRPNVEARKAFVNTLPIKDHQAIDRIMRLVGGYYRDWIGFYAVNCWHMNEHESAAMWKLYLRSNEGISIQSTYSKLRDSFIGNDAVYLGVVRYIDYQTDSIDARDDVTPFMHKRKSYEHEREVRALIMQWPGVTPEGQLDLGTQISENGAEVPVDIERLVERVYVAPHSPPWFSEIVNGLVTRYGYKFEVERSRLEERPLF